MPKRTDLSSILLIGSGPIIIGQGAEFDYSGTQAVRALKEEGYRVILVNSNPATIMTDPELADRTYVEPLTVEVLERVIERERPDALLPTVGGQTALNLAVELEEQSLAGRPYSAHVGVDALAAEALLDGLLRQLPQGVDDLLALRRGGLGAQRRQVGFGEQQARVRAGFPSSGRDPRMLGTISRSNIAVDASAESSTGPR